MRKETETELNLKNAFAVNGHVYTDPRITKEQLSNSINDMINFQHAYWRGVAAGRTDLHLRAFKVFFDTQLNKPNLYMFSYDEIVATSTLIHLGVPKRIAAAMVFHNTAQAVPANADFNFGERPSNDFRAIRICLKDDTLWDVAFVNNSKLEELDFVGDFAVYFQIGNQSSDPDIAPCPGSVLTIIGEYVLNDIDQELSD